jgi:hypothetical protein
MNSFFNKLSIYDLLGYIIPGSLIILVLNDFFTNVLNEKFIIDISNGTIVESIVFVIISYFLGTIIHELSQIIEKYIFKKIWGGFPSEKFLLKDDKKYSVEFKNKMISLIESEYDIHLDNTKNKNQEAFNLIYSTVQKLDGKDKIQLFNTIYGMCRSLFSGVIVIIPFYLFRVCLKSGDYVVNLVYIVIFSLSSYLLFRRCKRFSERFADYVYRDFYNYCNKEEK